jgi:hypothetical protein
MRLQRFGVNHDGQGGGAETLELPGVNPLKATVPPGLMHTGLIRWDSSRKTNCGSFAGSFHVRSVDFFAIL